MKKAIIICFLLLPSPAAAADLQDCHETVEAAYPGKIVGISGAPGNVKRIDFIPGASAKDRSDIQALVTSYNWNQKGRREIQKDIEAEMKKAASDSSLSDAEFTAIKEKLTRAQKIDNLSDSAAKLEEAKTLAGSQKNP